jgi:transcriptional regulator with XRE-family HTH domain
MLSDKNLFEVSRESRVSYNTIRAIASGKDVNPTYNTMKAISDYLESL